MCIIGQSVLLQSRQSSNFTLVSQAFVHSCTSQWQAAVAAHSSKRGELSKKTDPANTLHINDTVKYSGNGSLSRIQAVKMPALKIQFCSML